MQLEYETFHAPIAWYLGPKTHTYKISGPNLVTHLEQKPMFERNVSRCGSKNEHQKNMYVLDIGLHVQNLLVILGSMHSI